MAKKGKAAAAGKESARPAPIKPPEEVIHFVDLGDGPGPATASTPRKKGSTDGQGPEEPDLAKANMGAGLKKFSRGSDKKPVKGSNLKVNREAIRDAQRNREAVFRLVKGEVLQTEEAGFIVPEDGEKTWRYKQSDILEAATVGVAKKRFDFSLPYGPYSLDFSRNGQFFLAGGRKGHVAMMRTDSLQIECELQLKETVHAVQSCHNHMLYAVAQKKYLYMYDNKGVELHCIKDNRYPLHLDFLPYHFLLVSAGEMADLHYRDISTGTEVATLRTRLGATKCMRQNSVTAVMNLGHANGCVTMWTPTIKTPAMKLFCHSGSVASVAVHGDYLVTAGSEGYWKVWDMRKCEALHTYKTVGSAAADVDISMTGLLSIGFGSHVQIWKDIFKQARPERPYLKHEMPGRVVNSLRFRPYEDVLGVGHSAGFETLIIPGAGVANFDSFEASPFETKKQRQEREVHMLLEKLQPDSIMLDPSKVGSVDKKLAAEFEKEQAAKAAELAKAKLRKKKKMRGKGKVGARMKRKHLKEGKDHRSKTKGRIDGEDDSGSEGSADDSDEDRGGPGKADGADDSAAAASAAAPAGVGAALGRFYGKRRRKT